MQRKEQLLILYELLFSNSINSKFRDIIVHIGYCMQFTNIIVNVNLTTKRKMEVVQKFIKVLNLELGSLVDASLDKDAHALTFIAWTLFLILFIRQVDGS